MQSISASTYLHMQMACKQKYSQPPASLSSSRARGGLGWDLRDEIVANSSARWPRFRLWNSFFFLLYDHITSRSLGAAGQRCQVLSLIDYLLPSTSLPEGWRGVFLSATAATRRARAGRYYSSIHPGVHPSECNLLMVAGSMASMVVE